MLYYIRNGTRFFVQGATLGIDEMNMTQQLCHMILQEINKHNHNTDTTLIKGGKELSFENPKIDKVVTMQKTTNETEKEDKNETNINKIIGEKIERTKQEMNKNNDKTSNEKNINTNTNKTDKANNNDNIRNDYKGNKTTECRYFWRGTCKFGRECWFRHTELCQDWDRRNECTNDLCKLNHPKNVTSSIMENAIAINVDFYTHQERNQEVN